MAATRLVTWASNTVQKARPKPASTALRAGHQFLGFVLQREGVAEAAHGDAGAPAADAGLDHRRRLDALVEDDGHLPADGLGRGLLEQVGALVVELYRHLGAAGLRIPVH